MGSKRPPPFSLRLSFNERAIIEAAADGDPLGAFIKDAALAAAKAAAKRRRSRRKQERKAWGRIMATLGKKGIGSNLNQIAYATNCGAVPSTDEILEALTENRKLLTEIRVTLLQLQGVYAED